MDKCVVRQAIKEVSTQNIIGYEILFQTNGDDLYSKTENSAADKMINFLMQNSGKIFSDKPTFMTFTPSLLFRNLPKMFGKETLVIQIEDNLLVHPLALPMIKKYKAEGYLFAINDFQFSPKYFGMLEYTDYIRISVSGKDEKERTSLDNVVKMAQAFGKKCIATGVNAKEEYELAAALNVEYMEGNYIAETLMTKANKIDYLQGNFFQLVGAISKDEPDMDELEEIISRDAGLTYALLKMVNSAYFALRKRTASVRQAIVTMGLGQLREWVYMLSIDEEDPTGSSAEILKMSFLRAKFAQELTGLIHKPDFPINKFEAYMMGMFSNLEYMVDATMEEILEEIPVKDEVKKALISYEGDAGKLMLLILAYEKADWKESKKLAGELGIDATTLAQIYMDCIQNVNEIWQALTTDFKRKEDSVEREE